MGTDIRYASQDPQWTLASLYGIIRPGIGALHRYIGYGHAWCKITVTL